MVAVITGDIIKSRKTEVETWIVALKEILANYGSNPYDWESYRDWETDRKSTRLNSSH